jgi:hypothetical protein
MDPKAERIRERLLLRLPQPTNLAGYREEVTSLLAKEEKALRRQRWVVVPLWIYLVLLSTAFLWAGGKKLATPVGPWFGILACFCLIFGMVFFLPHLITWSRVQLLKEVKQVQLQVLELHAVLGKSGAPPSSQP